MGIHKINPGSPRAGTRITGWLALLSIALLALNLRTAVASLSPIVSFIQLDIPISTLAIGIIGTTTPLAFAVASFASKRPSDRFGLERVLAATVVLIVLGHLLRALAGSSELLVAGSALALLGMGVGNVLIPVLVRKYFPNRVGVVSSFYITITAISATASSVFAVPVADNFGWRVSLGQWALLGLLTLIPILPLALRKRTKLSETDEGPTTKGVWRSRTAWSLAGMQSITAIFGYTSFAWLPIMLAEQKGIDTFSAGALLGLFAILGLPGSLLAPILAARFKFSQHLIVWMSIGFGIAGPLGVWLGPVSQLWFWVTLMGLAPSMFPLALTLYNLRSESRATVLAVSAFGQGVSYSIASLAVVTFLVIREVTGNWAGAFVMLAVVASLGILVGLQIMRNQTIDSELRHAKHRTSFSESDAHLGATGRDL